MNLDQLNFSQLHDLAYQFLDLAGLLLVLLFIVALLYTLYLYLADVTQNEHAIRRNYPVLGRFRYFFEHMGSFFRQYFFAQDRDELPFNRAQRSWVYRAAKQVDLTIAFGSTRRLNQPGDIIFLNSAFPVLEENIQPPAAVTVGEGYAKNPYTTRSVFNISAMSFGALSAPAVRALSKGANKAGIWMNTGEGGLSPYHLEGGCDVVFQIGTAKYGVRDQAGQLCDEKLSAIASHEQVRMFEIKLSQGAKPGKGGILPGEKVTAVIASTRGIPEGEPSISPNAHPEIRCVDDLLDMVMRVRKVTGKPTGFKAVIGDSEWLVDLMHAIHRRGLDAAPDFITIDSADGGTGAAPQSLMDYMGLPIKRSLPLVADLLLEYGLKERIKIITSGKLINPGEAAWALAMGADFVVSARGFMFALGCIQALQCNKNTCPTGITTHDPDLQKGLDVERKAERVYHYARQLTKDVGVIAHSCGVSEPRQLRRRHAQIIDEQGLPIAMEKRHPTPSYRPELVDPSRAANSASHDG